MPPGIERCAFKACFLGAAAVGLVLGLRSLSVSHNSRYTKVVARASTGQALTNGGASHIAPNPDSMLLSTGLVAKVVAEASVNYDKVKMHQMRWGTWRRALPSVLYAVRMLRLPLHTKPGDVYQFGVFKGESLKLIGHAIPEARLVGCDSFQGLPDEAPNHKIAPDWKRGKWNSGDVRGKLTEALGGPRKVAFVKGFFNESLIPNLLNDLALKPAWYIDIDADLYSSTSQALGFMFGQGLVRVGTLIGYDDWWGIACSKNGGTESPLDSAEGLAHVETAAKYGVRFQCISGGCVLKRAKIYEGFGTIFLVVALNNQGGYDHGFHMTGKDIQKYCQLYWNKKTIFR